eukprot:TRINITY_DN986_c1_g1_i1.p1 TRINITY_DN986_c1_g1~~TRINITY_DN986_c1_g1_i1.p1  ORF type:complete len:231 (-),score=100.55 TRINITY_DN986_c1_g1_i1:164-856(-)
MSVEELNKQENKTTLKKEDEQEQQTTTTTQVEPQTQVENIPTLDLTVSHPLQSRWTLWYDRPPKQATLTSWETTLHRIYTFDTVEQFWSLYNNIQPASELGMGGNYHLFKECIEPKWEDVNNSKGGKWIHSTPVRRRKDLIDNAFLYAMLACIGGGFTEDDEICGCVVSIRTQNDRIALWTKHLRGDQVTKQIGIEFKACLEVNDRITYQFHQDAMRRGSSFNNRSYYEV